MVIRKKDADKYFGSKSILNLARDGQPFKKKGGIPFGRDAEPKAVYGGGRNGKRA